MNFTPKRADEVERYVVDFVRLLPEGVTIVGASWTITTTRGSLASNMIVGDPNAPTIDGSQVSINIGGGVPGVTYVPTCRAACSDDQVLILPEPGDGLLPVV